MSLYQGIFKWMIPRLIAERDAGKSFTRIYDDLLKLYSVHELPTVSNLSYMYRRAKGTETNQQRYARQKREFDDDQRRLEIEKRVAAERRLFIDRVMIPRDDDLPRGRWITFRAEAPTIAIISREP